MTHPNRVQHWASWALIATMLQGCNACQSETSIVAPEPNNEEEVFDHNWGRYLSMSAMTDGTPVLSYYDQTKTALGFAIGNLQEEDGIQTWKWTHEEVDGYADETGLDTGDRGRFTSLQVAADDTAWVAYQDTTNGSLRYAQRTSDGTWTTGIAASGHSTPSDTGLWASLALDADGLPVIAHYDAGTGELYIVHYAGAAFGSAILVDAGEDAASEVDSGESDTDPVPADVGQFASLVVAGGVEYIAYYDAAAGALKLAYGSNGSYSTEIVDNEGNVGQWPDIMVESGSIHITYQDVDNQDLKYASGEPGSWAIETVDNEPLRGADSEVFTYGSYIATIYADGYNNDLRFAWRSESGWQLENLTTEVGAYGFYNEVLTVEDETYVGCYLRPEESVWFQSLD